MNLLTIEHMTKSYTERLLFDDTSFSINEGEKIGLIGINGTGKSTLLKIVAGLEEPDEGKVVKGRNLTVRFLPQNPEFYKGDTILTSIVRENEGQDHVWDLESQAKTMLTKLGFTDFDILVETLSGGQRKRVALVSVLLSTADLLVLDEPTNHLDSSMAEWLEEYLRSFNGALLMVTHDRYFLDSVTNRIVELDKGKLFSYQTNKVNGGGADRESTQGCYEEYLKLKAERLDLLEASERKRQSILRVELQWMQRGARARSTKQKAHIERYETLRDQKGLETDQAVELDSIESRLGRTTVELEGISKAYGDKVLMKDFTYILLKNDRIGIIGPNGGGKSTLMKIIAGWVEPDEGTITVGQTVKMGYFSQENEELDGRLKVIDYIRGAAEYVKTKDGSVSASQMLERFLFPSSVQYTTIEKLSGGEKRRLYLLRILMEAPNVLLLDEPTNDLDIQTLTILEDYLESFPGIVITVSHDRYFLDRVVRRIFAFEGNGMVTQYEGGFTDYQAAYSEKHPEGILEQSDKKEKKTAAQEKTNPGKKQRERKLKFSFHEQREWDTIEDEITSLEDSIEELENEILKAASDYSKLAKLMEEKEEKETCLNDKMERWLELNELAEQIKNQ
ncbi:ribosomal protection-like ABC-F family protein [Clostridium sp. E02]|uniref:ribosomal protection-like ABC-F family protein n=1 Tax=Clostridium sp. E02 TaxID=2487134 RepID=UPI000F54AB02|nr:ABC-F family ATP-binding cassette domain-containing protein [Clostridium sp. E02]